MPGPLAAFTSHRDTPHTPDSHAPLRRTATSSRGGKGQATLGNGSGSGPSLGHVTLSIHRNSQGLYPQKASRTHSTKLESGSSSSENTLLCTDAPRRDPTCWHMQALQWCRASTLRQAVRQRKGQQTIMWMIHTPRPDTLPQSAVAARCCHPAVSSGWLKHNSLLHAPNKMPSPAGASHVGRKAFASKSRAK